MARLLRIEELKENRIVYLEIRRWDKNILTLATCYKPVLDTFQFTGGFAQKRGLYGRQWRCWDEKPTRDDLDGALWGDDATKAKLTLIDLYRSYMSGWRQVVVVSARTDRTLVHEYLPDSPNPKRVQERLDEIGKREVISIRAGLDIGRNFRNTPYTVTAKIFVTVEDPE